MLLCTSPRSLSSYLRTARLDALFPIQHCSGCPRLATHGEFSFCAARALSMSLHLERVAIPCLVCMQNCVRSIAHAALLSARCIGNAGSERLGTSDLPRATSRCPSNRLMQGAKRRPYVDMVKLCNAAADDSKGNPSKLLILAWDGSRAAHGVVAPPLEYVKYTAVVAPSPEQPWIPSRGRAR
jgi:hypothetical protein